MRVSCGCPAATASEGLVDEIKQLGLTPIVTSQVVRAVYEGHNRGTGEAIVQLYEKEIDHDITVFYDKDEQEKSARRAARKAARAAKNAKLHGHR